MQGWQVGLVVSVAIFVVGHLGGALWFFSRLSTKVESVIGDVQAVTAELKKMAEEQVRVSLIDQRVLTLERDTRDAREQIRRLEREQDRNPSSKVESVIADVQAVAAELKKVAVELRTETERKA